MTFILINIYCCHHKNKNTRAVLADMYDFFFQHLVDFDTFLSSMLWCIFASTIFQL